MPNQEGTVKVMEAVVTTTPTTHQGQHYYKELIKCTVKRMTLKKNLTIFKMLKFTYDKSQFKNAKRVRKF